MLWLIMLAVIVIVLFSFVLLMGPPYVPTLRKQTETALDLLDLRPGQTLLELGSGDGRVMLAAVRRGWKVIGIEINPLLVAVSYILTWKYRGQVRIIWGSYWGAPWPRADAVFTFMLPRYMPQLDERLEKWRPAPIKLASFAFTIPGKQPIDSRDGVYLYEYK